MNDLYAYFQNHGELTTAYIVFIAVSAFVIAIGVVLKLVFAEKSSSPTVETAIAEYEKDLFRFKILSENGEHYAALLKGDEVIVCTPKYSSLSGVKSALKSLVASIDGDNFSVFATENGFTVRLYSSTKLFFESEEYFKRQDAEEFIAETKQASAIAAKKLN